MPDRLSLPDTLVAVQVYWYYSMLNDKGDLLDEGLLFHHLNGRISRAMLRIAIEDLRDNLYISLYVEGHTARKGTYLYRANIKLVKNVEHFLSLKKLSPAEWLEQNVGTATAATDNVSSDTWEPLKNESNASQKEEVISAIEDVVRQVESDNGFAANEPEARNSLIYSLKVGVKMLKEHTPSREQVTANILKPLKYIGDLFAKHSIGELAKKATEKLMLWLSGS
jgi:hypothetical protein